MNDDGEGLHRAEAQTEAAARQPRAPVFADLDALAASWRALPGPDAAAMAAARAREAQLTKPAGALGRLEDLAIWYTGWRSDARPQVSRVQAIVFAGNHGVAARGVSAYPSAVTAQMVANFRAGGAAINQLADLMGARLSVEAIRLEAPTADFTAEAAMSEADFLAAVAIGAAAVADEVDCVILGEMGIGNSSAAAALAALLFAGDGRDWTGTGTGVSGAALAHKIEIVEAGVARHRQAVAEAPIARAPLEALRRVGGREMAAILGALLAARQKRAPVLLDGFIVTAVAAVARQIAPEALDHCVAAHRSAEPGHDRLLRALRLDPILDLGMRLGEGSGAMLAFGVLQSALACHSGMATFAEAGVSGAEA